MISVLKAFLIVLGVIGGVGLLVFVAAALLTRFRARPDLGLNDQNGDDMR